MDLTGKAGRAAARMLPFGPFMLAHTGRLGLLASMLLAGCLAEIRGPVPGGDTGSDPANRDTRDEDTGDPSEDQPADGSQDDSSAPVDGDLQGCPTDFCTDADGYCDVGMRCLGTRGDVTTCDADAGCDAPTDDQEETAPTDGACAQGALGMPCDGNVECDSGMCSVEITVQDGVTTTEGSCVPSSGDACFQNDECGAGQDCFLLYGFAGQCMSAAERSELCACGQGGLVEACP